MKKALFIGAILFLVGGCFGGYFLYQHHLSGDVKRLLVAANDEHASEMEVRQYVAQARPLVRTRKDREVLNQFEEVLTLLTSVQDDQRTDSEEFNQMMRSLSDMESETDECMGEFHRLIRISRSYGTLPKEIDDQMKTAYQSGKECRDRKKQVSDARSAREKHNQELAIQTMNGVRATLGLPPVPKQQQ